MIPGEGVCRFEDRIFEHNQQIDPRRELQKDQESITNRKKNRNPSQELDLGKTSKSEPISERFERGLNQ